MSEATGQGAPALDVDALMRAHLARVFNERDADLRARALEELYVEDAELVDPQGVSRGREAISRTIGALHAALPPGFDFAPTGPATGHHGAACLRWRGGPPANPSAMTGTDVARIEDGRIASLYVFVDPAAS